MTASMTMPINSPRSGRRRLLPPYGRTIFIAYPCAGRLQPCLPPPIPLQNGEADGADNRHAGHTDPRQPVQTCSGADVDQRAAAAVTERAAHGQRQRADAEV